jgi:hypothetical protein
MNCDAMTRVRRGRFAGVLAVATAVSLLLSTGGAALAQQGEAAKAGQEQAQLQAQLDQQRAQNYQLQAKLAVLQQQCEQLKQQIVHCPPQPENPAVKVFRLMHARAESVAEMLKQVYGDRLRVAVDQPSNTLIVLSGPEELAATEQLVDALDTPPKSTPPGSEAERTLQLRILWLMDGPPDKFAMSFLPQALDDTLRDLGLENPKVVSHLATTILTQHEGLSKFAFRDPVKTNDVSAYINGDGQLSVIEGNRYRVWLRFKVDDENGWNSELSGSLVMPLEHFVVLGTTDFVRQLQGQDGDGQSFPTAFVVYLQEAPIAPR